MSKLTSGLIQAVIFGALLLILRSPSPPPGADFLYSLGWYSSHAFAAVGNLFR